MGGVWLDGGRFVTTINAITPQLMGFVAMTAPHSPAVSHQHTDVCACVAEFAVACVPGGVDLASVVVVVVMVDSSHNTPQEGHGTLLWLVVWCCF